MMASFFLLIGGVQPKVKVLDETPRRCPRCGLNQAHLKRVDHYLSVFFIPIIRVKTGEPMLICNHCERPVSESGPDPSGTQPSQPKAKLCRFCGRDFPGDYLFCPLCGRRL
jgi:zinc-ribbon family